MEEVSFLMYGLQQAVDATKDNFVSAPRYLRALQESKLTPRTSEERLRQSFSDQNVTITQLRSDETAKAKTYLYLAYGSNLCALTFRVRRGIKPLSQVTVVVPDIKLTFSLPGTPYTEPCYGNVQYRDKNESLDVAEEKDNVHTSDYRKDRWRKGLVGVVYEVTASDYAHILETEGGGASYGDSIVQCFPLAADPTKPVPDYPASASFNAHTLFLPDPSVRPDLSYAQPSARYLALITMGAHEQDLPHEYRDYLNAIRPFEIDRTAQKIGMWLFALVWGGLTAVQLGTNKFFIRPDGTYPAWYAKLLLAFATGLWASYDNYFKPMFGDGERSIKDGGAAPKSTQNQREHEISRFRNQSNEKASFSA